MISQAQLYTATKEIAESLIRVAGTSVLIRGFWRRDTYDVRAATITNIFANCRYIHQLQRQHKKALENVEHMHTLYQGNVMQRISSEWIVKKWCLMKTGKAQYPDAEVLEIELQFNLLPEALKKSIRENPHLGTKTAHEWAAACDSTTKKIVTAHLLYIPFLITGLYTFHSSFIDI